MERAPSRATSILRLHRPRRRRLAAFAISLDSAPGDAARVRARQATRGFVTLGIIGRLLGGSALAAAAFGCAIPLYRFSARRTRHAPAIAAILIIGATAVITGLQFVFPEVLTRFRRDREALLAGEWWRMVTPLFVQAYGWGQCVINGVAAVIFCPLAERFYGKRLLALYFVPGVLGQIFGYLWSPNMAGSSLGIAGVIGGLFVFTFSHRRELPGSARVVAMLGMAGAIVLSFSRDIHGPPVLMGILLGSMMTSLWPHEEIRSAA